ncbi:MAG: hypothetical protein ACLGI2_10215 [Acidimicrobiia bacterium]
MPSTGPEPLPRRRSTRELLDHIYAEGERHRRRRRRLQGAGALTGIVALAAGAAVAVRLPAGSTPQSVAARGVAAPASPGSSTFAPTTTVQPLELPPELQMTTVPTAVPAALLPTPTPTQGTSTTLALTPAAPAPGTDVPASTTIAPATRSAAAPGGGGGATLNATGGDEAGAASGGGGSAPASSECTNSSEAACGPFRWEPDPGPNAPLVVTVTATPRSDDPRTFDFVVVYEDPDATIREDCRMGDFGDGGTVAATSCAVPACLATYGPWKPPAKEPGYAEALASHTFPGPGTYTVRFSAASGGMCGHPYASTGTGSAKVVVPG